MMGRLIASFKACNCPNHTHTHAPFVLTTTHGLVDILLMVLFRLIKIRRVLYGHVLAQGPTRCDGQFGQFTLFRRMNKNCRSVLRPRPTWIGGRMKGKEHIEKVVIRYLPIIKGQTDTFGVVLNVPIRWIAIGLWIVRSTVANDAIENALSLIEITLRAVLCMGYVSEPRRVISKNARNRKKTCGKKKPRTR